MDVKADLGCLQVEPNIYLIYCLVGTFPVYPWQRLFFPHNEVFIIIQTDTHAGILTLVCTMLFILMLFSNFVVSQKENECISC